MEQPRDLRLAVAEEVKEDRDVTLADGKLVECRCDQLLVIDVLVIGVDTGWRLYRHTQKRGSTAAA